MMRRSGVRSNCGRSCADQAFQPHGHHDGDAEIQDLMLDLAVGIERIEIHYHAAGLQVPK